MPSPLELVTLELATTPDLPATVDEARALLERAETFHVSNGDEYTEAAVQLKAIKGAEKALKARREKITKPMLEALNAVRAEYAKPENWLKAAEATLKRAMDEYDAEVERQRREHQRLLDAAAERERRRLESLAQRATDKGDADEAADLKDRAAMIVPAIVPPTTVKVPGIARREIWHAQITDLRTLVRAVADGVVPLAALEANMPFLHGQARALRDELRYPGVRAVPERNIAAGSV